MHTLAIILGSLTGYMLDPMIIALVLICFFIKNGRIMLLLAPVIATTITRAFVYAHDSRFSMSALLFSFLAALIWSLIIYGITYKSRRK